MVSRQMNAIDFWRGFALISIFINHIPGNIFSRFTHANYSPSDSAELFVFLTGWTLRVWCNGLRTNEIQSRLLDRATRIFSAHIGISALALLVLATSASLLADPGLLRWHNAGLFLERPVDAITGLFLLTHQLQYFNILPLHAMLLLLSCALVRIHRAVPWLPLTVSFGVYLTALVFAIHTPTWPLQGHWTFNPLTWQFVFVLGFAFAGRDGIGAWARRHITTLRLLAWPIVILGALVVIFDRWPNPARLPEPHLLFMTQKTFATPIRVIHFLALAVIASAYFPLIAQSFPPLATFFSRLGRKSLVVFCTGSVLSLIGQILRHAIGGGMVLDIAIVGFGVAALAGAASYRSQRSLDTLRRFTKLLTVAPDISRSNPQFSEQRASADRPCPQPTS